MPTILGVRLSHVHGPGLGRPIGPKRLVVADALEQAHPMKSISPLPKSTSSN